MFFSKLIFWESNSVRTLILKNLIAHKLKNKVTVIIYSLSLAFIILCVVAYKLEFKNFEVNEAKDVSDLEYRSVREHYIDNAA